MMPSKCTTITSVSQVKVSDKRSASAIFVNDQGRTYELVQFDGCVISQTAACDWIVEIAGNGKVAVELKGCDLDHAVDQILGALNYLRSNSLDSPRVAGLIVCSRYPKIDTKIQRAKQKMKKEFGAHLTIRSNGSKIEFDSLF